MMLASLLAGHGVQEVPLPVLYVSMPQTRTNTWQDQFCWQKWM